MTTLQLLQKEEKRKISDCQRSTMILVPEKPTSLRSIGEEVSRIKKEQGSCTVAVAEGFMPTELGEAINNLKKDENLRKQWKNGSLDIHKIHTLVEDSDLAEILKDPFMAVLFGKTIWDKELDAFGNGAKLAGIRHFVIAAINVFGKVKVSNECLENYGGRGATPGEYDKKMGEKLGKAAAEVVNQGIKGGQAVVYLEGMDPRKEDPKVLPLEGISNRNTLDKNSAYNDEILRKGGVFWKK